MESKKEIFKRLPPGDRWVAVGSETGRVYTPLTEALEDYFQKHGVKKFYIDAGEGAIYSVEDVPEPEKPIRQFSIYGNY